MLKTIEFYKVKQETLSPMHLAVGVNIQEILTNSPLTETPYKILNDNNEPYVVFDIFSRNEGYLFGTIGALKDPNDMLLQCLRDKRDVSQIISTDSINYYLEHFTYFCHRLNDGYCSLLYNQEAPGFIRHYTNYLNQILIKHGNSGSSNFTVNRIIDEEINEKITHMHKVSEIRLKYNKGSADQTRIEDIVGIYDYANDIDTEVTLYLKAKGSPIRDRKKESLLDAEQIKSNFETLKIIGTNQDEEEYVVDLIKRTLSKKIALNIDNSALHSDADKTSIRDIMISAM